MPTLLGANQFTRWHSNLPVNAVFTEFNVCASCTKSLLLLTCVVAANATNQSTLLHSLWWLSIVRSAESGCELSKSFYVSGVYTEWHVLMQDSLPASAFHYHECKNVNILLKIRFLKVCSSHITLCTCIEVWLHMVHMVSSSKMSSSIEAHCNICV